MINMLPEDARRVIQDIIDAESIISVGDPKPYNCYIAQSDAVTAISASGRFSKGHKEVSKATEAVSVGSVGERDRTIQWIACDYVNGMAYAVFKANVTILKEDDTENQLCWIITLIIKRFNDGWKLVHRQNTRSQI